MWYKETYAGNILIHLKIIANKQIMFIYLKAVEEDN